MSARAPSNTPAPGPRRWVAVVGALVFVIGALLATLPSALQMMFGLAHYRMPSGSMIPTLTVGDRIVAAQLPPAASVPRGAVVVFAHPRTNGGTRIARVVGLPGDRVEYVDRRVVVNGNAVPVQPMEKYRDNERNVDYAQFRESLGDIDHGIVLAEGRGVPVVALPDHTDPAACRYTLPAAVDCTVPAGKYFVMGDNRDNAEDSRFWGFVPRENLHGTVRWVVWNDREWRLVAKRVH